MTDQTRDPVHGARYAFARDGQDLIVDTWIEPGGGLPEHRHPHQQETWSVLEGEIRLKVEGAWRVIGPGDGQVVVPPGVRHALASVAGGDTHLRCRVVPALGLERFLTDSAAAARAGLFRRGGIPRGLRGVRWAAGLLARHREDVVMSSPPAQVQRIVIALFGRPARGRGPAGRPARNRPVSQMSRTGPDDDEKESR